MYKRAASGLVQVETYLSPINKVPVGSTVEQGNVWIRDGYTQNGSNYFGTRFVLKRYASLTQVWNIVPAYTGNSFQEVEAKSGVLNNSYIACRFDDDSKSFSFYIQSAKLSAISAPAVPLGETVIEQAGENSYLTFAYLNKSVKVLAVPQGGVINTQTIIDNLNVSADLINDGFKFKRESNGGLVVTNTKGYSFKVTQSGDDILQRMN
ncbi:UNVERIFIED_ORG: hypothetical protein [Escherichia phage CMSTMSU]